MASIFSYKSKKGIVFLAKDRHQAIFNINDNLIASQGLDYDLADLLRNADAYLKKDSVLDFLKNNYSRKNILFIGNYNKGLNLYRFEKDSEYLSKTDEFDYFSDSAGIIESRLLNLYDSGFKFSYCKTLSSMLEFLYRISKDDEKSYQFGFLDKYGAKTLFSPDIEFSTPPREYEKRGDINQDKFDINSEFYRLLINNLENTNQLLRGSKKFSYNKSFFNLKKKKHEKKISNARKDSEEIINRYLDYDHGLIERFTIRNYLEDLKTNTNNKPSPKIFNKRKFTIQQRLDKELLPAGIGSVLLSLSNNNQKLIQDSMYSLEKELGMKVRPFLNMPSLSIKGDVKDVNKFYSYMDRKKYSKFSRKSNIIFNNVKIIEQGHGVYFPELIQAFMKGENYSRISTKVITQSFLWNLQNIGSIEANKITTGKGVNVAVEDTGIDYTHKEFKNNFNPKKLGYDFVNNSINPMDREGHGTHVAGTIAGNTTGVGKDCNLYAVRVLDESGTGFLDDILLGIDWCISNNIDIVNLSLGSPSDSKIERDMYEIAYKRGMICVAAAGNEMYGPSYPASYDTVIAVAAVDRFNKHAPFSNIYPTNNVSAPGIGIQSTLPDGDYGKNTGTSMASPHIAGVCALILSRKNVNKDSVQKIIEDTAMKLGDPNDSDNWSKYGCGLVQAQLAIHEKVKKWKRSA